MNAQSEEYKAKRRQMYAQDKERFRSYQTTWKNNPDNVLIARESHLNWIKNYRYKDRANSIAKRLVPLKEACEICGGTEHLQRHHKDYGKPLEVLTLCRICHNALEAIEPPIYTKQHDIRYYKGMYPVEVLDAADGKKRGQSWACKVLSTGEVKQIPVSCLCYLPHKITKKKKPTEK